MAERELLYASAVSRVYRIAGTKRAGPLIAKVTAADRLRNLVQAHQVLKTVQGLDSPPLLRSRANGHCSFALYPDVGLQPVEWTEALAHVAVGKLAQLHQISLPFEVAGMSHTPPVETIVSIVRKKPWPHWRAKLQEAELSAGQLACLARIYHQHEWFLAHVKTYPLVWCHGDAHYGNFMWRGDEQKLYFIDFEFAHYDVPLFDLYQMLDATSPTDPLRHPASRSAILYTYWGSTDCKGPFAKFLRDYLYYATWHHLWILDLIDRDLACDKYEPNSLNRQKWETIAGLSSMVSDVMELAYEG